MAIEAKRGCGYRKLNALYLVGGFMWKACDRLPLALDTCPTCGSGIKFSRGMAMINPYKYWGMHQIMNTVDPCSCRVGGDPDHVDNSCFVCCPPDDHAFVMFVGEKFYSPESFIREAHSMGISKRIPHRALPKELIIGKSVIYLAHKKAVPSNDYVEPPLSTTVKALDIYSLVEQANPKPALVPGVICAFVPRAVEILVKESELTDEYQAKLSKKGITPIPVPDGDPDHKAYK